MWITVYVRQNLLEETRRWRSCYHILTVVLVSFVYYFLSVRVQTVRMGKKEGNEGMNLVFSFCSVQCTVIWRKKEWKIVRLYTHDSSLFSRESELSGVSLPVPVSFSVKHKSGDKKSTKKSFAISKGFFDVLHNLFLPWHPSFEQFFFRKKPFRRFIGAKKYITVCFKNSRICAHFPLRINPYTMTWSIKQKIEVEEARGY